MSQHSDWPRALRAAMATPVLERKGWQQSLAPNLIGLFLWIGFFDQIPRETVGRSSLAWPVLGLAVGGALSYLLLFRVPLLWTQRTGRPLAVVATSTFGIRGATWLPGLLNAALQVVWIAVATRYATVLTLRGLELVGLLNPSYQQALYLGGRKLPGGLFLATSFVWGLAGTLAGRYLVRVIGALMTVYPVLIAVLLGVTAAMAMRGLPDYRVLMSGASARGVPVFSGGMKVALTTIQMVFAFAAAAALSASDWGALTTTERDIRRGGWVSVTGATLIVGMLSVLTVAGAFVRYGLDVPVTSSNSGSLTFVHAVESLIGGKTAGAMLMVIGLAGLAPACFSSYLFTTRFHESVPRISRTKWTILGFFVSWLLVVFGQLDRLFSTIGIVGAVLAPVLGAIVADAFKAGGVWPGARAGVNRPGVLAWLAGTAVGLPAFAFSTVQPGAVVAFTVAFFVYLLAAAIIGESRIDSSIEALPETPSP